MKRTKASVALLLLAAMSLTAFAEQPHMDAALGHLRAARAALIKATANKAGHRQRAMELIDQAIAEVEQGKAAAR
jgi:hypothetical protein